VSETKNIAWLLTSNPENLVSILPSLLSLCMDNIRDELLLTRIVDEIFNQVNTVPICCQVSGYDSFNCLKSIAATVLI
jgi:hypothetical protein